MNLESRLMIACFTGLVVAAGTACGQPPGPVDDPPELVEEEESETSEGTETNNITTSDQTPEPVEVGCDPRAPGVPCCTTTLAGELGSADPYVPWSVRRDGDTLDPEPMTAMTFEGYFRGMTRLEHPAELDCPVGSLAAKLECTPEEAMTVELEDGSMLQLIVPFSVEEMALTEGKEVEIDFAEGLRVWDEDRNIVLHLYRPPREPWKTFERVYGPLRVSLVPQADDFSTAICIADADAHCGGVRIERLVIEGDTRTTLESGQTTIPAESRNFRVFHLFSAQPLQRNGDGCADLTPPQPSYAVLELD